MTVSDIAGPPPRFDLEGRVVLVTGAARGLGRAIALACAAAGADIALGLRRHDTDDTLMRDIEALGRTALPLQLDILDLGQIRSAVKEAEDHFGRIDILVNNAGLGPENPALDVVEADFDLTMGVNVKGTFFMCQAVGRGMVERGGGRIVNISSQAGSNVLPGESVYCMSKAAVDHLTRCLAREWGPKGVTVNAVAPTFLWTDATSPSLAEPDFRRYVLDHIPLGRIGTVNEAAGAVVFLASPAASLVNGAVLLVDGGWSTT
jgi:NAD(P)-dependent dehydrogenase (short-subunit alcohol dehydrogenase family)